MKRTMLRRSAPLRRNKRLNARSQKKIARDEAFAPIRERVLAEHPYCQAMRRFLDATAMHLEPNELMALERAILGCQGRSTDVHHKRQRSVGGDDSLDNLIALCRHSHDWTHDNIALATKVGLLRPSWEAM